MEDYYLQLIDFGIPHMLDYSEAPEKNKNEIRILAYKIMLATFLINCLKFYDICRELCDGLSSILNELITPSDWDKISGRRTFNWVMKSYLKRLKGKKYVKEFKGPTKAFFTKASLYFEMDKGPGKLTIKSKYKKNKGRNKSKNARKKK